MTDLPANPNELLVKLVDADARTRPQRDRFMIFRAMSSEPGVPITHPGLDEGFRAGSEQDIEDLAEAGYIRLTIGQKTWQFDITRQGREYAKKLRLTSESRPTTSERGLEWTTDVLPVLLAVGRAYSDAARPDVGVTPEAVAKTLGRSRDDELDRILYELEKADYVEATMDADQDLAPAYMRPTEKGLQVTSGWPGGEAAAAAALLAALSARIDAAESPEERGRLERARDGLVGLGKDVLSDLLANVLTGRM